MPRPWWTAGWATSPPIAWTSASSRGPRPFKNHSKSTASAWLRACDPRRPHTSWPWRAAGPSSPAIRSPITSPAARRAWPSTRPRGRRARGTRRARTRTWSTTSRRCSRPGSASAASPSRTGSSLIWTRHRTRRSSACSSEMGGPEMAPQDHPVLAPPAASAARSAAGPPTAVAARATTAPGATLGLWARLVHDQVAIADGPPIAHLDRLRGLFFRRHLDEAEPARPARELVGDDPHGLHGPRLRKQLAQVFFRRLEGKIADEQLCRHLANLLPSLKAARYGTPASARGKDNDRRQRMSRSLLGRITLGGLRALDASGVDAARRAAVHRDADARDERGARGGQEAHDVGDVLGRRDPAELVGRFRGRAHLADGLARRLRLLLHQLIPALRARGRRRHGRDEDAALRAEVGEPLGEIHERRVGCAAREIGRRRVARGRPGDVDDAAAALGLHDREHGARHANVAHELEAPVVEPLGVRDLEEAAAADRAGVVDEHVDAAASGTLGLRDDALHLRQLREVGADGDRVFLTAGARLGGQLVERRLVARHRDHARALVGHPERDRAADAAAGARHHHHLVVELEVHTLSSLSLA